MGFAADEEGRLLPMGSRHCDDQWLSANLPMPELGGDTVCLLPWIGADVRSALSGSLKKWKTSTADEVEEEELPTPDFEGEVATVMRVVGAGRDAPPVDPFSIAAIGEDDGGG
ncbi:hypothetical protein ACLOJK_022947 [Asimina triloba]